MEKTKLLTGILDAISCDLVELTEKGVYYTDRNDFKLYHLPLRNSVNGDQLFWTNKFLEHVKIGENQESIFASASNGEEIRMITYYNHGQEELKYEKETPKFKCKIEINDDEALISCTNGTKEGKANIKDENISLMNLDIIKEAFKDFVTEGRQLCEIMKEKNQKFKELVEIIGYGENAKKIVR